MALLPGKARNRSRAFFPPKGWDSLSERMRPGADGKRTDIDSDFPIVSVCVCVCVCARARVHICVCRGVCVCAIERRWWGNLCGSPVPG